MLTTKARFSAVILLGCVVVAVPATSGAQVVSGRVVNGATGRPLAGVGVKSGSRMIATDTAGRFTIARSVRGPMPVHLRLIGYAPKDTLLDLLTRDTIHVVLGLAALPTRLDTVSVEAPAFVAGQITEFEERRFRGEGRYVSTAELRRLEGRPLVEVLRARMPGLGIMTTSLGTFLFSRAQTTMSGAPCYLQVVWDGMPIFRKIKPPYDLPPDVEVLFTRDFDGVEYYSSPTRTPVQYRGEGSMCGTLMLWSRRK